jgi:ppGpp synthetase/RelA/SpoT-type nucleotidyltranferase
MPTAEPAQSVFRRYAAQVPTLHDASDQAQKIVESVLANHRANIHLITARPKSLESAFWKVLRKSYAKPDEQLTDKISVRVIYYENDVDRIVKSLAEEFEIDATRSTDKRAALGLRSFGYRSVHLIARLKGFRAASADYAALRGLWFEIQVRSILEHAWAEIEHEIVYKSGTNYPDEMLRRFAAIAGTLELIEREFLGLRTEKDGLIEDYRHRYERGMDKSEKLDTARMLGLLESEWPKNLSWRQAETSGKPFPPKLEERCVFALSKVGITQASKLLRVFRAKSIRRALNSFASAEVLSKDNVSHVAIVLLAVAIRNKKTFRAYFPSMADSGSISMALRTPKTKKRKK